MSRAASDKKHKYFFLSFTEEENKLGSFKEWLKDIPKPQLAEMVDSRDGVMTVLTPCSMLYPKRIPCL